jgi:hypothetical protein
MLSLAQGKVVGQCFARHRNRESLKFLRRLDQEFPDDIPLHLVMDNYGTHKHPKVQAWLKKHPCFLPHFVPTCNGAGKPSKTSSRDAPCRVHEKGEKNNSSRLGDTTLGSPMILWIVRSCPHLQVMLLFGEKKAIHGYTSNRPRGIAHRLLLHS